MTPRLTDLFISKPRDHTFGDVTVHTAMVKEPVHDLIWLGTEGLAGNAVGNTKHHGGPEMAVCVSSGDHLPAWREDLPHLNLCAGSLGENFTVSGQDENSVCVGDIFEIGEALVQVSKPREPCVTIAKRWQQPDFVKRIHTTGRTGWYLRVLREGHVEAGARIKLIEQHHPEWTCARVYLIHTAKTGTPAEVKALAKCEALDPAWRKRLLS